MTKGWKNESERHSLSAKGIRTGRKGTLKAGGVLDFKESQIYLDDEFIKEVQKLFKKTFGYDLPEKDAKWYLKVLWKQFKEDSDFKEELKDEVSYAREDYNEEMKEYRREAKEVGGTFEKTPFNEWFSDREGYLPTVKEYLDYNQERNQKDFNYNVEEEESLHDNFDVFVDKDDNNRVYIERLD